MIRLNLFLALILVACAVSVVTARHESRQVFTALQREQARARELDVEWGRLLLEQSTWAMHTRVELVAHNQLQMVLPDPAGIHLLRPPQDAPGGQP